MRMMEYVKIMNIKMQINKMKMQMIKERMH